MILFRCWSHFFVGSYKVFDPSFLGDENEYPTENNCEENSENQNS